jgi:hypothetical protein
MGGGSYGRGGPLTGCLLHSAAQGQRTAVGSSGDNADFAALSALPLVIPPIYCSTRTDWTDIGGQPTC